MFRHTRQQCSVQGMFYELRQRLSHIELATWHSARPRTEPVGLHLLFLSYAHLMEDCTLEKTMVSLYPGVFKCSVIPGHNESPRGPMLVLCSNHGQILASQTSRQHHILPSGLRSHGESLVQSVHQVESVKFTVVTKTTVNHSSRFLAKNNVVPGSITFDY